MKALAVLGGVFLAFVLALASMPWILWAVGCAMIGDDRGFDAASEARRAD